MARRFTRAVPMILWAVVALAAASQFALLCMAAIERYGRDNPYHGEALAMWPGWPSLVAAALHDFAVTAAPAVLMLAIWKGASWMSRTSLHRDAS